MSTFTNLTLGNLPSSLAKWGPMSLQGPHQVAQ